MGNRDAIIHPLTIIVNAAIIVLVTILHELLDVVFCDGLTCSLKHQLQLIQVDIAISISGGGGRGEGEGDLKSSWWGLEEGKKQPHP